MKKQKSERKIKKANVLEVKDTLSSFVERTEQRLQQLEKSENNQDIKKISEDRKKIKSLSANLRISDYNVALVNKTNKSLYDLLDNINEKESSTALVEISHNLSKKDDDVLTESTSKQLLSVNSEIATTLKRISEDMIDEQDTTIKKISDKDESPVVYDYMPAPKEIVTKSWLDGLLQDLLAGILGGGLLAFFTDMKDLKPYQFATKIFQLLAKDIGRLLFSAGSAGLDFVKTLVKTEFLKIAGALSDISSAVFKKTIKLFEPATNAIKASLKYISDLTAPITKMIDNVKGLITKTVDTIMSLPFADKFKDLIPKQILDFMSIKPSVAVKKATVEAAEKMSGVAAKTTSNVLGKKIPFGGGLIIASGFASARALEGDYVGAGLELASGLAAMVPVIGTTASLGIDAGILYRDYHKNRDKVVAKSNYVDGEKRAIENTKKEYVAGDDKLQALTAEQAQALQEYKDFLKSGGKTGSHEHKKLMNRVTSITSATKTRKSEVESEATEIAKTNYTMTHSIQTGAESTSPEDATFEEVFHIPKGVNVRDLDPSVKSNLLAMGKEYTKLSEGGKMTINSGYRSISQQKSLNSKHPNIAASPGNSMHNYGLAVDLNSRELDEAENRWGLLKKYGFDRPARTKSGVIEKHHIQPIGLRLANVKNRKSEVKQTTVATAPIEAEIQTLEAVKTKKEMVPQSSSNNLVQNQKSINNTQKAQSSNSMYNYGLAVDLNSRDLDPSVKSNLLTMGKEHMKMSEGEKKTINSGYSSISQQKSLNSKDPNTDVAPDNSMYNYGLAVDLNSRELDEAENRWGLLKQYGVDRPAKTKSGVIEKQHIPQIGLRLANVKTCQSEVKQTTVATTPIEAEIQTPEVVKTKKEMVVQSSSNNLAQNQKSINNTQKAQSSNSTVNTVSINNTKQETTRMSDSFGGSSIM